MKGFKTIAAAIIASIISILDTQEVINIIPESLEPLVAPFVGVLMIVMRYFTSTSMFKKN